jgi:acyl dehydratase
MGMVMKMPMVMPKIQTIQVGDELAPLRKGPITRQHLVEWCAAENDYYTLHYDERVAERMKLPGTPIQGTLKYALMSQVLQKWLGDSGTLQRISANYRGLNLEGEVIIARAKVSAVQPAASGGTVTLEVWIENEAGERSTSGEAVVELKG